MGWKEDYGGYWIRSFLSRDRDQDPGSGVRWGREDGQPGGKGQHSVESSHRHKRGPDPGSLVEAKLSLTLSSLTAHTPPSGNPGLPAKWIQDLTTAATTLIPATSISHLVYYIPPRGLHISLLPPFPLFSAEQQSEPCTM